MSKSAPSRGRRVLFGAIMLVGLPLIAVMLAEGAASLVLLSRDLTLVSPLSERRHVEYDSLLGWVNSPNVQVPDMYGPGKDLRINAQRFRADGPTSVTPPEGRRRVICSGDSFTLGFGVANDATWCHLLQAMRPHLETVNMGQAGYGIGQAYLWYRRDGVALQHDALVFAYMVSRRTRGIRSRICGSRTTAWSSTTFRSRARSAPTWYPGTSHPSTACA